MNKGLEYQKSNPIFLTKYCKDVKLWGDLMFCAKYESLPEPLEYKAVPEVPERLTGDIPGLLLHHLLLQLIPQRLQLCLSKTRDSRMRYF
jgi:hypothetical protein